MGGVFMLSFYRQENMFFYRQENIRTRGRVMVVISIVKTVLIILFLFTTINIMYIFVNKKA